jgi:hypothetical protein
MKVAQMAVVFKKSAAIGAKVHPDHRIAVINKQFCAEKIMHGERRGCTETQGAIYSLLSGQVRLKQRPVHENVSNKL